MTEPARTIFVVAHTGRDHAREVCREVVASLRAHGLQVRMLAQEAAEMGLAEETGLDVVDGPDAAAGCELCVVIGGDGTVLRAAEYTHPAQVPLLGVNLGHVGFLAEAETDDVDSMIDAIVHRRFASEERLSLDVRVFEGKKELTRTWALNEASVEKAARERMLLALVEVDGRPVTQFGCDGVVCATPTGSTAYNFSAGGPVVWPSVEALLMVPISAHALFARPLVVDRSSVLAVEVLAENIGAGVLWCDGRRTAELPPGARIEVRRHQTPVRFARLHQAPFTDRLVAKFDLPVAGWRGASQRRRRDAGGEP